MGIGIKIVGGDRIMILSKVTMIKSDSIEIFHLDRLKDGSFRLTYSESLIPEITKVTELKLVRDYDRG